MLHDHSGNRKYLTTAERNRFIEAAERRPFPIDTFCLTLAYSGARISEVLALRAASIDMAAGTIVFESLKKRRRGIFRQVPVPGVLLATLDERYGLAHMNSDALLWPWSRTTAWKAVKSVMVDADAPTFCTSPKALRHTFGVIGVVDAQVPLNMMQKWLGHSRIETTAIYANAVGPEERVIASRMWE